MANCRKCAGVPNANHTKSCSQYVEATCSDCGSEFRTHKALHDHQGAVCPTRLDRLVKEGRMLRG